MYDSGGLNRLVVGTVIAQRLIFAGPGGSETTYPQIRFWYDAAGLGGFTPAFGISELEAGAPAQNSSQWARLVFAGSGGGGSNVQLKSATDATNTSDALVSLFTDTAAHAASATLKVDQGGTGTSLAIQNQIATLSSTAATGIVVQITCGSGGSLYVSAGALNPALRVDATGLTLGTPLTPANGGTGLSAYTIGDLLYASAAGTLSKLADVATGNALISGGVGAAPSWGKIGLTTHVTGTLGVGNGGTGAVALTGYLKGNGAAAFTAQAVPIPVADGGTGAVTHTNGNFLKGAGVAAISSQAGIGFSDINADAMFTWSPTWGGLTIGNATTSYRYQKIGKLYFWFIDVTLGTTSSHTGALTVTLPATPVNIGHADGYIHDASVPTQYAMKGKTAGGAVVSLFSERIPASDVRYTATAAGSPAALVSTDEIHMWGFFDVA